MILAENLERGQPLSQAAVRSRLRMGTAMKLAVRLGESLGSLGPAMRQQIDDSQQTDAALAGAIGRLFYLTTVILVMTGVITFVMLKIVPIFQRMFEEFGLKLPAMTRLLLDFTADFRHLLATVGMFYLFFVGFIAVMFVLMVPALVVMAVVEYVDSRQKNEGFTGKRTAQQIRAIRRGLQIVLAVGLFWPLLLLLLPILYYAGWFPRNLPIVWRLFSRYDGALVMRGLALSVRRGMPLPAALHLVAESYPLSIIQGRLYKAAERVEAGADWCESLWQTGLIAAADAAVLRAAQRAGNLAWALEEMADSAIRRQVLRIMAALQLIFPVALLTIGAFVFFFVCGLFLPLIALIQGLA